jgi:hypothetical protein
VSALGDGDWRLRVQQATLTDTSRVFVVTVRNREANQAHPGQERSVDMIRHLPVSGHSQGTLAASARLR